MASNEQFDPTHRAAFRPVTIDIAGFVMVRKTHNWERFMRCVTQTFPTCGHLPSRNIQEQPSHRDDQQPRGMIHIWLSSSERCAIHRKMLDHQRCVQIHVHRNNPNDNGIVQHGKCHCSMVHQSIQILHP